MRVLEFRKRLIWCIMEKWERNKMKKGYRWELWEYKTENMEDNENDRTGKNEERLFMG